MTFFRRFIREDAGFSLVELLAAMAIGGVVLTGVMTVFTTGLTASGRILDRVDSTSRARIAMDRVTTLLNSQVCLISPDEDQGQAATPPVVAGSTANSITFYADLDGNALTPAKYTLTYDPTAKTLTQYTYQGTGTMGSNLTFPTTPTSTKRLVDNVQAPAGDSIFNYYSFTASGTIDETAPLAVPISTANAYKVVRVNVKLQTNSARTKTDDKRRTVVYGQGAVATSDPVDQTTCP
ncbi:PilW family protein [Baekduia sp. Peel2402]|uniref:PilW family protein n=1 Tax=Baekduia sp. Peel2402 TaxID=3458296 RepID=UPI00403E8499